MRQAIRQALIGLGIFGDRVFEMQVPSKDTEKPFCVVRFLADTTEDEWLGYRRVLEIYPYLTRTTFANVDDVVKAIIQRLDRQLITDQETKEAFTCIYRGCGQDFIEDEWDAISRVLTFDVLALRYFDNLESYEDEWVADIIERLGEELQNWFFYRGSLPQNYNMPAILVRVKDLKTSLLGSSIVRETKTLKMHIFGSQADLKEGLSKIVNIFRVGDKVNSNNSFYTVEAFMSNLDVNPFSDGQITLELSKTSVFKSDGEKIKRVLKRGEVIE